MAKTTKLNFEEEWKKITPGFGLILNAIETGKGIENKDWMVLYNSVFQLAIAQNEEKIFLGVAKVFKEFVEGQSKKIFSRPDAETMLKDYLRLFGDFMKTALSVSRICRYLERYWIPGNASKTFQGVEVRMVYPLALVMWRKNCFDPIKDRLIPSLLNLLDKDREGSKQDKTLIRNMVISYIEFDKVGPNEGQQFYEKEFEVRYIDNLKQFYRKESGHFLQQNGVSLYLQKAEERINEEKANSELLGNYLTTSEPKIKRAIDEVLIEKHMEPIQADFLKMLKEDKEDDMRRLYFLLSRVPDGLPNSAQTFQVFLIDTGSKIVQDQKKKAVKEALANAVTFVKQMIQFYDKYSKLTVACFSSHSLFKTSLDKAFRDLMNQDCGKFNMPRLLNYYIDNIIKGKEKDVSTEEEIDDVLQRLANLFSYLQDKDEFLEHFRKALCKRLLNKNKQYNENAEKSFLAKLKSQTGDATVRRLQGMFTDVQDESIQETMKKFEQFNGGSNKVGGVDMEVQVLNESHWPISGTQKFPLLLSKQLLDCQQKFQTFYDKSTEKRRLQWLYNYGSVTLAGRFTNTKLPVQLVLTPLQASILLCFSPDKDKWSFSELVAHLWPNSGAKQVIALNSSQNLANNASMQDMSLEEILRFAIQPLVYYKYKVLSKEKDEDPKKELILNSDIFILREKIPAKKLPRKIPFPQGSAQQQQAETKQTQVEVLKQREFEIDAAMVRVMKARNKLDWNNLQIEVNKILISRFIPDPKMLKKRLESLIDRKFMERDENDPKTLLYIS